MVNIAEQAIIQKSELKKVILLEHLPRADSDHLAALAIHSNSALRQFASTSIFSNQILVASHSSLSPLTEEKTVAIFGPRNRGDGIHLRGTEGARRHTSSVISHSVLIKPATLEVRHFLNLTSRTVLLFFLVLYVIVEQSAVLILWICSLLITP